MIPKVCDFGLRKNLAKEGQARGQQMGTPAYMAPEQSAVLRMSISAQISFHWVQSYTNAHWAPSISCLQYLDLLNAVASQPHPTPRLYISDLEERYIQPSMAP